MKRRIEQNTDIDPMFKQLFVQQMMPILDQRTKSIASSLQSPEKDQTNPGLQARVIEMPRADIDLNDPEEQIKLESDKIDS